MLFYKGISIKEIARANTYSNMNDFYNFITKYKSLLLYEKLPSILSLFS